MGFIFQYSYLLSKPIFIIQANIYYPKTQNISQAANIYSQPTKLLSKKFV
jgi:hypothetical protein